MAWDPNSRVGNVDSVPLQGKFSVKNYQSFISFLLKTQLRTNIRTTQLSLKAQTLSTLVAQEMEVIAAESQNLMELKKPGSSSAF